MSTDRPRIKQLLGRLTAFLLISFGLLITSILGLSNYAAELAAESNKTLLPKIHEHQRAALNLERLERMGDLVAFGGSLTLIRTNALAAQVLAFQPSFEFDDNAKLMVRKSYRLIKQLRITRQKLLSLTTSTQDTLIQQQQLQLEQSLRQHWSEHKLGIFELQNRIISDATQLQTQTLQQISHTHKQILLVGGSGIAVLLLVIAVIAYQLIKHLIKPVSQASNALLAIEAGEDYHLKPAQYEETATIFHAADRLSSTIQTLHEFATTDSLTNCSNRRYFVEQANTALMNAHKNQEDLALVMMDIDHFKKVNDIYGHAIGDQTLKLFSQWVTSILPEGGKLGRLGGEEFALLLPDYNEQAATTLANHIRELITEKSIDHEAIPTITVSMGVKVRRRVSDELDTLLSQADKALYQAKKSGRNRVIPYSCLIEPAAII